MILQGIFFIGAIWLDVLRSAELPGCLSLWHNFGTVSISHLTFKNKCDHSFQSQEGNSLPRLSALTW